jgi:hypothetical protein
MKLNLQLQPLLLAITFYATGVSSSFAQEISPYLFGQNHWLASGDEGRVGYVQDLWPEVKASGVKMVRIGGNGYERQFPERSRLNAMIDNIKGIGAEPILQVPRFFNELQIRELVRYYTKDNSKKVKYWSIGNEPMLHNENTLEEVHSFLLRIAPIIKDVAPDVTLFMYDESSLMMPAYGELIGGKMDVTGLKHKGRWLFDGVTFHNYPNGKDFSRDDVIFSGPQKILGEIKTLKDLIAKANKKYKRQGDDALLWGLTEFNVTYHNPDREISGYGNTSFLAGQFFAEIFGYGMEYSAFTIDPWCISEVDKVATDFGFLGLPTEFFPRSNYYHMQLMSTYMTGSFLVSNNNQKYVKTIVTQNPETTAIMILNQEKAMAFDYQLNLAGSFTDGSSSLLINTDAGITATLSGEVPAQSTLLLVVNKQGKLIKKITYGLTNNLKYEAPQITPLVQ